MIDIMSIIELFAAFISIINDISRRNLPEVIRLFNAIMRENIGQVMNLLSEKDLNILSIRLHLVEDYSDIDAELYEYASRYVDRHLHQWGVILSILNSKYFQKILDRIMVNADMRMIIDKDLNAVTYQFGRNNLTVDISDFPLLVPCNCVVTNYLEKYRLFPEYQYKSCPLHSKMSEDVRKNFSIAYNRLVQITYDGVSVYWMDKKTLWPPSIDSLFFAKVLRENYKNVKIREILDAGAGTGFLGLYMASVNNNVKQVTFSDIFLLPLFMTAFNVSKFIRENSRSIKFNVVLSNGLSRFRKKCDYDMILSNPPYIPLLGYYHIAELSSVSGTYLLKDLIVNAGKYSPMLIIMISSVAQKEFEEAVKKVKIIHPNLKVMEIASMKVPFRVATVYRHRDFLTKLLDERKNYLSFNWNSPFPIWHTIKIYELLY